jgi:hypothetical protein
MYEGLFALFCRRNQVVHLLLRSPYNTYRQPLPYFGVEECLVLQTSRARSSKGMLKFLGSSRMGLSSPRAFEHGGHLEQSMFMCNTIT